MTKKARLTEQRQSDWKGRTAMSKERAADLPSVLKTTALHCCGELKVSLA